MLVVRCQTRRVINDADIDLLELLRQLAILHFAPACRPAHGFMSGMIARWWQANGLRLVIVTLCVLKLSQIGMRSQKEP